MTDLKDLRNKSLQLSGYLELLLDEIAEDYAKSHNSPPPFINITPRDPAARGCQISILFPASSVDSTLSGPKMPEVFQKLLDEGVIGDSRAPDVIRISPAPLYNSFADVWRAGAVLRSSLGLE